MRRIIRLFLYVCLSSLLLSGCQSGATPTAALQAVPTPAAIATPQAGNSNLTARILNIDGTPIGNVAVRLAEVFRKDDQGAFALDIAHSPGNFTDADGTVAILNFKSAEYLLVVGEPSDNNYVIVHDGDGKPISYQPQSGETLDVGEIKVDYKP